MSPASHMANGFRCHKISGWEHMRTGRNFWKHLFWSHLLQHLMLEAQKYQPIRALWLLTYDVVTWMVRGQKANSAGSRFTNAHWVTCQQRRWGYGESHIFEKWVSTDCLYSCHSVLLNFQENLVTLLFMMSKLHETKRTLIVMVSYHQGATA